MEPNMDASLVTQCLNFHGQLLQKVWESERGEDDLSKIGVGQLDFAAYQARQKNLSFQDRGKRLKLHQFIAKEAPALFDVGLLQEQHSLSALSTEGTKSEDNLYALMPPFETFLNVDKVARLRHFFDTVKAGELIIGTVINRSASGMMLKVLCTVGVNPRYVADINVKAFLPVANIIPAVDKKNVSRNFLINDTVCCEVMEVIPDTDKMVCSMKGLARDTPHVLPLGLLNTDDFPLIYKKTMEMKGESYEAILEKSTGFNNPNCVQYLSQQLGLTGVHCTNFSTLRGGFPPQECAAEIRQTQASKWAFRSVAEGIEHFKGGRHSEAFQCLNKALSIDPRNVEGLVARGALYANSGTFKKAIEDFETSLKLNPSHANARKYMGETLVALGRSYEDENKIPEAKKAYEDCLAIIPFHEEAQDSLNFLKSKMSKPLIEPAELLLPALTNAASAADFEMKERLKQLFNLKEKKDKKSKKKKRIKGKKKQRSSSSSSSSSDSSSSSSSSHSSSDEDDSSDSDAPHRKKKRRSRSHAKRQRSLSPLSKRMAQLGESDPTASQTTHNSQFNHPYGYQHNPQPAEAPPGPGPVLNAPSQADLDYEMKVRKFLEMTKEDSEYETKVRTFLEEAARYKRDRKMQELGAAPQPQHDKAKKRKTKKESKKSKKESKKKRKEREREERRKAKLARVGADFDMRDFDHNMGDKKFRDALRKELKGDDRRRKRDSSGEEYERKHSNDKRILENIPNLEELESKLSEYYAKVKKDAAPVEPHRTVSSSPSPEPTQDKPKWKMSMNSVKDKMKKKETNSNKSGYKDKSYAFEESSEESQEEEKVIPKKSQPRAPSPLPVEKNVSVRRAMALKEPPPARAFEPDPPGTEERPKQNIVLDKFGSFRLVQAGETVGGAVVGGVAAEKNSKPATPATRRPRSPSSSSREPTRKRSRSRSRPRKYRSRSSRSRSSSSGGESGSPVRRRRSTSAASGSGRSDASHSRHSRSSPYYSRSRSRERSTSRDRFRRFNRRGNWGRGGNRGYDRGTYYRPRFTPYNNGGQRGRGRGGGDFRRDDGRRFDRGGWRDDRGRGRPFRVRQRGMNHRGRPFHRGGGFRDFRDRRGGGGGGRYSHSRSPERRPRSRSYSPEHNSRRHSDIKDRESYSRYSERSGQRSEGEYEEERYVDRKEYDGKWADRGETGAPPPTTNNAALAPAPTTAATTTADKPPKDD